MTELASNRAKVRGTLTMHGVSKEVVLDAEYLGKGKDPKCSCAPCPRGRGDAE